MSGGYWAWRGEQKEGDSKKRKKCKRTNRSRRGELEELENGKARRGGKGKVKTRKNEGD